VKPLDPLRQEDRYPLSVKGETANVVSVLS
jgi:hypothetical protein